MEGFSFLDLTACMRDFLTHWKKIGLFFDCVYSGFLGNPEQIEIAEQCMQSLLLDTGFAFVDPVLGDNGVLDPTQTPAMIDAQRHLVSLARVIAPNLTEAAFLLQEPYCDHISQSAVKDQLRALSAMGPEYVVITSVPAIKPGHCAVLAFEKTRNRFWRVENIRYPVFYPGTGDTFSSVLLGALLQGASLPVAVSRAVSFVSLGIALTYGYGIDPVDGILLEKALPYLHSVAPTLLPYEEV